MNRPPTLCAAKLWRMLHIYERRSYPLAAVKAGYLRDCRPLASFFAEAVERGRM